MEKKLTRRQEREFRRLKRIEAMAKKKAELEALLQRAKEATSRIPPEFQDWGVTKTSAYCRLQEITARRTQLKHPPLQILRECLSALDGHAAWSLERCAEILQLPGTASTIHPKK